MHLATGGMADAPNKNVAQQMHYFTCNRGLSLGWHAFSTMLLQLTYSAYERYLDMYATVRHCRLH